MRVRAAAYLVALVAFFWAAPAGWAQTAPPEDPHKVVEAFVQARGAGDLDTALAQFSDDAIVTLQGPTLISYRGKDQVRSYLRAFGINFQTVTRTAQVVQGNTVTWTEHNELEHHAWDTTVLAVVRSGHIASLWYRQTDGASTTALVSAVRRPGELPAATWAGALGLIGFLLLGFVFGRRRRPETRSELDGRLLVGLRQRRRFEQDKRAA
jgi:hypothetical protein